MAIQTINLGGYANDGTGDDLRTAFEKVNANFEELDDLGITGASNLGAGTGIYAGTTSSAITGDNLTFKSLVAGNNTTITSTATTITINTGGGFLFEDLNLNGNSIIGNGNINISGNITVQNNGIVTLGSVNNVKISGGTNGYVLSTDGSGNLNWIAQTGGGGNLDFGTFVAPAGFSLDLGTF